MKKLFLTLNLVLFVIPFGISQDLPSYVPTDGLVAYYPFNGNANDESGNGYHGAVNGATVSTDRFGNSNQSYFFKGESNITIPDSPFLNIYPLTISLWYKLNGLLDSSGNVVSKYQPASWNGFQILYDYFDNVSNNRDTDADSIPDHIDIDYNPSAGDTDADGIVDYADIDMTGGVDTNGDGIDDAIFTNYENDGYGLAPWYLRDYNNRLIGYYGEDSFLQSNVEDDRWFHYVFVVNQNEGEIYVDGKLIDVHKWTGSSGASTNNYEIKIGGHYETSNDSGFYGDIDDVGIWNRALSEQEIQNLYNSSIGDILLNGTVSVENNQIKNVANPTDAQDAVTKSYLDNSVSNTYTQSEVDAIISEAIAGLQDQIDALQSTSGSGTVTDQDGNSYPYLTYGDQVWTVKNAEMVTYRDGTPIPQVTDDTEWVNLTTGAWCYYDNDPSKGKLYNWYAVAGIHDNDENTPNKDFAPEGWHVPSDSEWTELENYLIANGYNYDGTITGNKIAKAMASTTGWDGSIIDGAPGNDQFDNNSSGFSALPTGTRYTSFSELHLLSVFWSSTHSYENYSWFFTFSYDDSSSFIYGGNLKTQGMSIRFVKD